MFAPNPFQLILTLATSCKSADVCVKLFCDKYFSILLESICLSSGHHSMMNPFFHLLLKKINRKNELNIFDLNKIKCVFFEIIKMSYEIVSEFVWMSEKEKRLNWFRIAYIWANSYNSIQIRVQSKNVRNSKNFHTVYYSVWFRHLKNIWDWVEMS